jgi:hypothetical protein
VSYRRELDGASGSGGGKVDLAAEPSLSAGSWDGLDVLGSTLVLLGLPVRWMLRPVTWPLRMLFGRGKPAPKPL